jgi:hypothetical protein
MRGMDCEVHFFAMTTQAATKFCLDVKKNKRILVTGYEYDDFNSWGVDPDLAVQSIRSLWPEYLVYHNSPPSRTIATKALCARKPHPFLPECAASSQAQAARQTRKQRH